MKKEFTVEELQERIADINNYYLANAINNGDKNMVNHWNRILQTYEQNLAYLKSKK